MNKGIFSKWFREFATLVLTQSVQAFLLAIVMTIIISALGDVSTTSGSTNYAAGMLAIIALSQFGKIELLVKNIFGVTSQFGGSMESGRAGFNFAKGLAIKGARSALDNVPKAIGGAKGAISSSIRMKKYGNQLGELESADKAEQEALNENRDQEKLEQERVLQADRDKQARIGTQADILDHSAMVAADHAQYVNGQGGGGGLGMDGNQFAQLLMAVNNTTRAVQANHTAPNAGTSTVNKDDSKPKEKTETQQKIEDIKGKIANEKANRDASLNKMKSGIAETIVDPIGAVAGGAIGGYASVVTGQDLDQTLSGAMSGAGIGIGVADKVAQSAVNSHSTNSASNKAVKQSQKDVVKIINNNVQQIQQNVSNKSVSNAKAANPNLTQEQIKKIGEEAAKQSYEKMKDSFKNNFAQASTGKSYKEISQRATNSKNPVTRAKNSSQKNRIDKAANKAIKDISNIG